MPIFSHCCFCPGNTALWSIGCGQRRSEDVWMLCVSHQNLPWTWPSSHKWLKGHSHVTSVIWPGLGQSWRLFSLIGRTINSMSASDRMTVSLPLLSSLDSRLFLSCGLGGWALLAYANNDFNFASWCWLMPQLVTCSFRFPFLNMFACPQGPALAHTHGWPPVCVCVCVSVCCASMYTLCLQRLTVNHAVSGYLVLVV